MNTPDLTGTQSPLVRADLVFFETPKGGGVFSVSSIAWMGSLSHNDYDNNVSRITENVLRRFSDPAPFYIQRALPLLGRTLDDGRVYDVLCALSSLFRESPGGTTGWNIAGRGRAGVIAAYGALLEPRVVGVTAVDPPTSHRDGPIFLNVLRVLDVPDALGLLASRELSIFTPHVSSFEKVQRLYQVGSGAAKVAPMH